MLTEKEINYIINLYPNAPRYTHSDGQVRLGLRKLENVTKELAAQLVVELYPWKKKIVIISINYFCFKYTFTEGRKRRPKKGEVQWAANMTGMSHQFLRLYNYAVPLWLGRGHWANKYNAIELGVAVELD